MAQNNRRTLAYVKETVYGQTPGTPQTQLVDFVSFEATLDREMIKDPSVNPTGQTKYIRGGNKQSNGTLEVVLRPDNQDDFLAALMKNTWATNSLTVGSAVQSFAFEEGFGDLGQYRVLNGAVVDTMKLSVAGNNLVTASFGLKGSSIGAFSATSIDSTPTAVTTKTPFYHQGGTFNIDGSPVGWIKTLELEVANNYEVNHCLGSNDVYSCNPQSFTVKVTATGLFESVAAYNDFISNTTSSLSFTLTSGAESLTFNIGSMTTVVQVKGSGDGSVEQTISGEAFYDVTNGGCLKITRV